MASAAEYEGRIATLEWEDLRQLWAAIQRGDTPGWEPGKAFEYLVLRAFQLDGAVVTWPYRVSLFDQEVEQIDGAVHCASLPCLVESKDLAVNVSFEPIAKLRSQLLRRPSGVLGLMFSSKGFTVPARLLAQLALPRRKPTGSY
jgi:hypothetical protein